MDNRFDYAAYNAFVVAHEACERELRDQEAGGVLYDRVTVTFPVPQSLGFATGILLVTESCIASISVIHYPPWLLTIPLLAAIVCIQRAAWRILGWKVAVTTPSHAERLAAPALGAQQEARR